MELRGMSGGKFLNGSMAFFTTGLGTEALALRAQPSLKLGELKYGWSGAMTSSFHTPSSSFARGGAGYRRFTKERSCPRLSNAFEREASRGSWTTRTRPYDSKVIADTWEGGVITV